MDVENVIREYLVGVLHMSLGTSSGDQPWVCEVHFVYDNDLSLYFRSKESRRHSQDIVANPKVAGNIVEQHAKTQKPRGVYFEGHARIVQDFDQGHPAYPQFIDRLGASPEIVEDSKAPHGHKVYKITVSDFYLFDARDSKPGQKYHLKWM